MFLQGLSYRVTLLAALVMYSCGHKPDQPAIDPLQVTAAKPPDKDAAIYDFVTMVIDEQTLDRKQRLVPMAENEIGKTTFPSVFEVLLIDTTRSKAVKRIDDWKKLHREVSFKPSQCLTAADIAFMLRQQKELNGFVWDNSRMHFTISNTDRWYVFSIPLFSLDSTKALITIRDLCKGLCGTGRTLLYQKKEGKWSSSAIEMWYH